MKVSHVLIFLKGFIRDPLSHWPFVAISRGLFKNTAGFRQNVYGAFHYWFCRIFGRRTQDFVADNECREIVSKVKKDGFALVEGWVDADTLRVVRGGLMALAEESTEGNDYYKSVGSEEIVKNVPKAFDLVSDKIKAVAEEYFGCSFLVQEVLFRLTKHVPRDALEGREVYSEHWHFDSTPTSELAIFINVNDVTKDDGPTAIIGKRGSHDVMDMGYLSRSSYGEISKDIENHPGKAEFIGPAGTMIFTNTAKCIHRAGIPGLGRQREWMQFRLVPTIKETNAGTTSHSAIFNFTHGQKY